MITRQVDGLTSSSQHSPTITAISDDKLLRRDHSYNRRGTHSPDGRITGDLAVHFTETPFHHFLPVPFHVTLTPLHFLRNQPVQPLATRLRHLPSAVAVVHREEVVLPSLLRSKPYLRTHRVLHLLPAPNHRR
ncbi:hypothetical protein V8G54_034922 [Vigna mungo]|uniref:Uncharacterized protein n=1 Tax=Vigna mungo TaxID=3915 RepID=A0AAQ3MES2_VIGMU